MAEQFDPYRKWLAIPSQNQPPNHYQLLGIPTQEDDPDVIENAADRQMAHVRTFQSGKHSKESQQILNELASAKRCLLTADMKSAYDAELKNQLATKTAPPPSQTTPIPASQPQLPPSEQPASVSIPLRDGRASVARRHRHKHRKPSTLPLLFGIVALAVLIGIIALVAHFSKPPPEAQTTLVTFPGPLEETS